MSTGTIASTPVTASLPAPTLPADVGPEVTVRAILLGVVFGAIFGAANAYLGLRVGMTVSTSIPIAVMTVAVLRATGARASILEANMAQTIGSASTALATGAIFTVPALYLWGQPPSYLQIVGLTLCGGILGVSAMIPLRRLLIVRAAAELPYPEGRACADVLRASTGSFTGGRWIFGGLALGAIAKIALDLLRVAPSELLVAIPGLPGGELALEVAPALVAVGYILGYRPAAVVVSGGLISSLMIIPLVVYTAAGAGAPVDPASVWGSHVRFIGAGAVALAGIVTVVKVWPAMVRAFAAVAAGMRRDGGDAAAGDRRDRDVPGRVIALGIAAVVLAVALVPGLLGAGATLPQRLVSAVVVGVLGLVFVAVAARIVGQVGVSSQPTSAICLVTVLVVGALFAALGWTSAAAKVAVLLTGAIVAIAASKAGDISQDLKTGQLVGATPARQQLGQYLGAATACWAVAATLLFLGASAQFGSKELPAPQATLMKTVIEGGLDGTLPWALLLAGAGLALAAMFARVDALTFAIGVYLPLGAMTPILVGGVVRRIVDARRPPLAEGEPAPDVLAASGMIAGEGLAGVAVAALVGAAGVSRPQGTLLAGVPGQLAGLALVVAVALLLVRAGRRPR